MDLATIDLLDREANVPGEDKFAAANASGEARVETPPGARLITVDAHGQELQVAKQAESALTGA